MLDAPVVFALVCLATGSVEYSNERYESVLGFYSSMPDEVRELFTVIEYRAYKVRN